MDTIHDNNFKPKKIALVEIHGPDNVSFAGTWETVDDQVEPHKFLSFAESIGFIIGISAKHCDDIRILPEEAANKMYEDAKVRQNLAQHNLLGEK